MKRILFVMVVVLVGLLAGCDMLTEEPPTPIYVTPTSLFGSPGYRIVTNTPTPSASPVLAPTLPGMAAVTSVGSLPTTTLILSSPTPAITATRTFTPTPTDTPITPGAIIAPVGVSVPAVDEAGLPANCAAAPQAGFGTLYAGNPQLAAVIGCPLGAGDGRSINSAYQTFQDGMMIWVSSVGDTGQSAIYAVYNNGTYQRFNDTWQEGVEPASLGLSPPAGMLEPIRGFGKVWRESPGVRDGLGWATSGEIGGSGITLALERGDMIYLQQTGQTYVLVAGSPGTWQSFNQSYDLQ